MGGFTVDGLKARGIHLVSLKERLNTSSAAAREIIGFLHLGWLLEEVADCHCADNGRPGIAPEVAVRLMLAGLLLGIVHDRRLMQKAQVNVLPPVRIQRHVTPALFAGPGQPLGLVRPFPKHGEVGL